MWSSAASRSEVHSLVVAGGYLRYCSHAINSSLFVLLSLDIFSFSGHSLEALEMAVWGNAWRSVSVHFAAVSCREPDIYRANE